MEGLDSAAVDTSAANTEVVEGAHSGKVGYGPNYKKGPSVGDKLSGTAEILKGKITKKPELVQEGQEKRDGTLQEKEEARKNEKEDPFKGEKDGQGENPNPKDVADSG